MTARTALVTGVSGHVGAALAERLQAGRFAVRALVRTEDQATSAARRGLEPRPGDLAAPESLREAVAGAEVVVHAAAYVGPDAALAETVNVDGTARLAEASLAAGVQRFVHLSTMSVYGEPQPDGLTEDSPLDPGSSLPYVASKARAELSLGDVSASGLSTTVLRPGAVCSAHRSRWGDDLIARLRTEGWPRTRHPDDVIPWVHTDDLAEMTWLAATHPAAAGRAYIAVDRCVAIDDFFGPIADALGVEVKAPNRPPAISRCHIGGIREDLGYYPRHSFEHTVQTLVELAAASSLVPAR